MNKIILIAALLTAVTISSCTSSIQQKIEKLEKDKIAFDTKVKAMKNDSLRQMAGEMGQMLFALEKIDLENQIVPTETQYTSNPLAILDDYSSTSDLVNNYVNGILVNQERENGTQKDLKIIYPFEYPFQQSFNWKALRLADNRSVVLKGDEYSGNITEITALKSHDLAFNELTVYYPSETADPKLQPAGLIGQVNAVAPKNVLRFSFSTSGKGDTQEKNGISVKLVDIRDHQVKIEVTNPKKTAAGVNTDNFNWLQVQAMDGTKQYLSASGSSSGSEEMFNIYKRMLQQLVDAPEKIKDIQNELQEKEEQFEAGHKDKYYRTTYFKGKVQDIVVYVYDYSQVVTVKKDLDAPVRQFEDIFDTRSPVLAIETPATVYDHVTPQLLAPGAELLPSALDTAIKTDQSPYRKASDTRDAEDARLRFNYPDLLSNEFIHQSDRFSKLKNITFYDHKGGTAIAIPIDSTNLSDQVSSGNPLWLEFQMSRVEYNPYKFPKEPHYVSGVVEVQLADIKKNSYPITQLPSGMKIQGNQLITDAELLSEAENKYFVKDKSGRYLKIITTRTYEPGKGDQNRKQVVRYYYGRPSTVEHFKMTGSKTVEHHFEAELPNEKKEKI